MTDSTNVARNRATWPHPKWVVRVRLARWSVLFALAGLCISIYLTAVHYAQGQVPLACVGGGLVNCEQVTTSAQSMVGPLPVAALGVMWFAVLLGLAGPARSWARSAVLLQLGWTAVGVATVFYLIYAELYLIGAVCLWCTAVHILVFGLFLLALGESSTALEPV